MKNYGEETFETRRRRYEEKLKKLTMMSDMFARNVLKDRRCCESVLRVIMEDRNLTVIDHNVQADYKNLHGRSVVLDCIAKDGNGRVFNVEIQQKEEGALPKRARYHLGIMDTNVLNPGEFFDELPDTYVVFVTRDDTLGHGLPIVHIDRTVRENGKEFDDGAHFIYVDSSRCDDTELGRLMHDFHCENASDMQNKVLAERVRELKETEKGVEQMCREMEEIRHEGIEEGRLEGIETGISVGRLAEKKDTAKSLANDGMPLEKIAQILKVDVQVVRKWLLKS